MLDSEDSLGNNSDTVHFLWILQCVGGRQLLNVSILTKHFQVFFALVFELVTDIVCIFLPAFCVLQCTGRQKYIGL